MLLEYRPAGFGEVHDSFKDSAGAWTGIFVDAFSVIYHVDGVEGPDRLDVPERRRGPVPVPTDRRQVRLELAEPLRRPHLDGFEEFMADRGAVERLRQQVTLYAGEVKGDPSPGRLGVRGK